MAKLIKKQGDLFTTDAPAIGHGVNCVGLMGAGIAVKFREFSPAMYEDYHNLCRAGSIKPGTCSSFYDRPTGTLICNIASQNDPGPDARYVWLIRGVMEALDHCKHNGIDRLALPYIGAGIGGLDKAEVEKWLKECAESGPVDIELWDYKP